MQCSRISDTGSDRERTDNKSFQRKGLRELALPEPVTFSQRLEFVAQRKLHDAWVGKQAAVVAEAPAAA